MWLVRRLWRAVRKQIRIWKYGDVVFVELRRGNGDYVIKPVSRWGSVTDPAAVIYNSIMEGHLILDIGALGGTITRVNGKVFKPYLQFLKSRGLLHEDA